MQCLIVSSQNNQNNFSVKIYQFLIAVELKEKYTINSRDKNNKRKHPNEIGVYVLDYKYSFLYNKSARCYFIK